MSVRSYFSIVWQYKYMITVHMNVLMYIFEELSIAYDACNNTWMQWNLRDLCMSDEKVNLKT